MRTLTSIKETGKVKAQIRRGKEGDTPFFVRMTWQEQSSISLSPQGPRVKGPNLLNSWQTQERPIQSQQ